MERLTDIGQYDALMSEARAAHGAAGPAYTNWYATADAIERSIDHGQLYVDAQPGGLLFLSDFGNFYKLQLWLLQLVPFAVPRVDKPVVTEIVFRKGRPAAGQAEVEALLIRAGLRFYREMHEFTIGSPSPEVRQRCEQELRDLQAKGYRFAPVPLEASAEAHALLARCIDRYDLYGYEQLDWPRLCGLRQAFGIRTPQGALCAVCVVPQYFRGGLEAVAAEYRGQGLGRALKYYSYHMQEAARAADHLWIASDNAVNLHLAQAMGGSDSLRRTRSYVMDPPRCKAVKGYGKTSVKIELRPQDDLVILGTGTLIINCIRWLRPRMTGKLFVYEDMDMNPRSNLRKALGALPDIIFRTITPDVEDDILRLHPKIILSIGNSHVFRKKAIDCCPIINYHNALLPYHPGRNVEAWSIYEQDAVSGVTWHFVNEKIDNGYTIRQQEIPLDAFLTSIRLMQIQTDLAFLLFQQLFTQLLQEQELTAFPQKHADAVKMHYSWEKPNGGVLDISWSAEKISAFLRAMDYGALELLGRPRLQYKGDTLCWRRYRIEPASSRPETVAYENGTFSIYKKEHTIRLLGVQSAGGDRALT